ncbi:MAG: hypothetical protein COW00_11565 [Bdellovibrio sp. CG12_big_fil_rev_8_21_14_0_65_39_13]|nr:MAG: hypothetical protein COW78_04755 [Bdellovibrio sp. CG22_combo_CG10-13_8_21_14_all_39_27]PIQ59360.1 MAG: hypothetical protein COW00_11565 [Bdellovibrio sp. CG12_big_fil_rev_8_21_14_0_65_39_13]PIR32781.1 MAG: hypothetical protein COV37_18820 [Bdellovibrio sp. CG11_big_fil_rev_8_21_14_0_20_39_38]PJB52296.1 MAG: hypothetical protein CO099_13360 [Bdellovibrio sp. CG_4_9_14_3_um_filter_39_7]
MKTIKSVLLIIASLFSFALPASEWNHQQLNTEVQISFTKRWLVPTYGSRGGMVAGIFYVDVRTHQASLVESVRLFRNGQLVSVIPMVEDHEKHFYGRQQNLVTYADFLYVGQEYVLEVVIDGQLKRSHFRL